LTPTRRHAGQGAAGRPRGPGPGGSSSHPGALRRDTKAELGVEPVSEAISERESGTGGRSVFIVPVRSGNRAWRDPKEGREAPRLESHWRETWERTLDLTNLSTKRQWIADLARSKRGVALRSLHHVVDLEWMKEAWRLTRKDGAAGIDGVVASDYAAQLEVNLLDLLERIKSGRYQAPAVRRTYIPKADGTRRPLGIPTLEDKVAQRAIVMVLEAIYEQDFLDCSYGFRPGRSAHQALQDLRNACMDGRLCWVLDVDISKYFDTISHEHLRSFLDQRVTDGVIRRMIDKWLKAGVMEEGLLHHATKGSPQGGVISPLLANIFLHHVLDEWYVGEVRPRLRRRSTLVRYADDFVLAFEEVADAERVLAVLGKRFERYGLMLHPGKTRFVDFRPRRPGGNNHPGTGGTTFDFLGFTHVWGKSRRGNDVVRQVTAKNRLARGLAAVSDWCRRHRHRPIAEQHRHLTAMARGHYAYYGMSGNIRRVRRYGQALVRIWQKWLSRRGNANPLRWSQMRALLQRWPLPRPSITRCYTT
jgi:RNA-directed DNA polymerase